MLTYLRDTFWLHTDMEALFKPQFSSFLWNTQKENNENFDLNLMTLYDILTKRHCSC